MWPLLAAVWACAPAPDPTPEPPPAPAPVAPAPADGATPAGSIGGEPILDRTIVMGAIAEKDVDAGLAVQMESIEACYSTGRAAEPTLAGKVLVKFTIGTDGSVTGATTRSTSLRHPATEACINDAIAKATFPALTRGRLAIVHYPFSFGP